MLRTLSIRDFVIVDNLELELGPGFTALTGETGAGKSLLIDALQFVLGDRAEPALVREGAARAEVCARFAIDAGVRAWLAEAGFGDEDPDLVLVRRTLEAGGRSRAWIDGGAATAGQLRALGEQLLDVHGQHAHQSLLRPAAQLQLLDDHGALGERARAVTQGFEALRAAVADREQAEAIQAGARERGDTLRDILTDLAPLAPLEGEWEKVEAEQRRLAHGAALLEGAREALAALDEDESGLTARLARLHSRLSGLLSFDARLQPVLDAISGALVQGEEASRELQHYLDGAEFDGAALARAESRMGALHAAARRWRCAPAALPSFLAQAREEAALLGGGEALEALRGREREAREAYRRAARALSDGRREAAARMEREVGEAMAGLSMQGARLVVRLHECGESAHGLERAEFLIAAHGGDTARPLARVASGGELSRISLSISVVAAQATRVPTLLFDEVDSGIGGAVAAVVGELLRRLGGARQVLCVTHLPQVAACAHHHLAVDKSTGRDGRPRSGTRMLSREERVEEIARMLGGAKITELTRRHAKEMLGG
jgi:DNA repair protein RecN (Recombination protein N)